MCAVGLGCAGLTYYVDGKYNLSWTEKLTLSMLGTAAAVGAWKYSPYVWNAFKRKTPTPSAPSGVNNSGATGISNEGRNTTTGVNVSVLGGHNTVSADNVSVEGNHNICYLASVNIRGHDNKIYNNQCKNLRGFTGEKSMYCLSVLDDQDTILYCNDPIFSQYALGYVFGNRNTVKINCVCPKDDSGACDNTNIGPTLNSSGQPGNPMYPSFGSSSTNTSAPPYPHLEG